MTTWQPRWQGIRTKTYQYIEYLTDGPYPQVNGREYYDLTTDPYEMANLLGDGNPLNDPNVPGLHKEILRDNACVGKTCP